jgi:hypothetical protein
VVSPSELVDAAVRRSDAVNPALNAVIHPRFDRASGEAAGVLPDGPFRGVPLLVKDALCAMAGEPHPLGMVALRDAGCRQAVMEVSSHGIDQHRVSGLQFGAAVFTNLTRDHLDYHKTLDAYFEVKTRLFTGQTGSVPRVSVVNVDDPYGAQLAARIGTEIQGTRVVTFGEGAGAVLHIELAPTLDGRGLQLGRERNRPVAVELAGE